jgi:hypothetical protein
MTCIVAKPGQMASDSRDTGVTKRSCVKMFQRHSYLVGGAGDSGTLNILEHAIEWPARPSVEAFTRWVFENHDPAYIDFHEVEFVICSAKQVWVIDGREAYVSNPVGAVGSGAAYARGYLEARPKDLDGAVAAACKYDPYCAGPIRRLELQRP